MAQAVAEEYKSSLCDLNFNSKPHINMLTMLAEENKEHAAVIVQAIVNHIDKVAPELKLPGLYLVDSIVKNIGEQYLTLFCQHMISLFSSVFEKVDESTRSLLFKLRQTWNDILPNKLLYGLDLSVKKVDPAWPITATPPLKRIHINPRFFGGPSSEDSSPVGEQSSSVFNEEDKIKQQQGEVLKQLLAKQEQLRLLELRKLEIMKKKKRIVGPSVVCKQNFKTRQDTRMVKINKVHQHTSLPKENISSSSAEVKQGSSGPPLSKSSSVAKLAKHQPAKSFKETEKLTESNLIESNQSSLNKFHEKCIPKNSDKMSSLSSKVGVGKLKTAKKVTALKTDAMNYKTKSFEQSMPEVKKCTNNSLKNEDSSVKVTKVVKDDNGRKNLITNKAVGYFKNKSLLLKEGTIAASFKSVMQVPKKHFTLSKFQKTIAQSKPDQLAVKGSTENKQQISNQDKTASIKNFDSTDREKKLILKVPASKVKEHYQMSHEIKNCQVAKENISSSNFNSSQSGIKGQKRDYKYGNDYNEPAEKKQKNGEDGSEHSGIQDFPVLFGKEDQDQRCILKEFPDSNSKGWAQYKEAYPDEFRSPILTAEENIGPVMFRRHVPRDYNEHYRRGYRMQRGRFNARYCSRRARFMRSNRGRYSYSQIGSVMLDPQAILREAEEKYHSGRISEDDYMDLRHDLQKMLDSTEYRRYKECILRLQNVDSHQVNEQHEESSSLKTKPELEQSRNFQYDDNMKIQGPHVRQPAVKSFKIDNEMRLIHFVDDRAFVMMGNNEPRELSFKGDPVNVFIEGLQKPIHLNFDGKSAEFEVNGQKHSIRFGTPTREVYIDNYPYEAQFGGPHFAAKLDDGRVYKILLSGSPPSVLISKEPQYELLEKFRGKNEEHKSHALLDKEINSEVPQPVSSSGASLDVDMRVTSTVMKEPTVVLSSVSKETGDVDWRRVPPKTDHENENNFSKTWNENMPNKNFEAWNHEETPVQRSNTDYNGRQSSKDSCEWRNEARCSSVDVCPTFTWVVPDSTQHFATKLDENSRNTPPHREEWKDMYSYQQEKANWNQNNFKCPESRVPSLQHPEHSHLYKPSVDNVRPFDHYEDPRHIRPSLPYSRRPYHDRHIRGRMRNPRFVSWTRASRPRLPEPRHFNIRPFRYRPPVGQNMPQQPLLPLPKVPLLNNVPESSTSTSSISQVPNDFVTSVPTVVEDNLSSNTDVQPAVPLKIDQNINVEALLEKLVAAGIISSKPYEQPSSTEPEIEIIDEVMKQEKGAGEIEEDEEESEIIVPKIELKPESLRVQHTGVISNLYKGSQCASCGMRFKELKNECYSRHLDWHFRMNRREKDGAKKALSRFWYYQIDGWVQFEEFEDLEERAPSYFELLADNEQVVEQKVPVDPSVPAAKSISEECTVCGEKFELFWLEEEEEWHLRNAVQYDDQEYHPACYEDYKKGLEAEKLKIVSVEDASNDIEEQQNGNGDEEIISWLENILQKIQMETEEKSKNNENLCSSPVSNVDESVTEMKSEHEEDILEGKPGEEEIIGVISESDVESESNFPKVESKMVIMQSGGITLKVKAESLQPHSPAANTPEKEAKKEDTAMESEDFRPPTPDPRFQVMPPISKGRELSGLCCIM